MNREERNQRDLSIAAMRSEGHTLQEIADQFGVTKARVQQILNPEKTRERVQRELSDPDYQERARQRAREYRERPEIRERARAYAAAYGERNKELIRAKQKVAYQTRPDVVARRQRRLEKMREQADILRHIAETRQAYLEAISGARGSN